MIQDIHRGDVKTRTCSLCDREDEGLEPGPRFRGSYRIMDESGEVFEIDRFQLEPCMMCANDVRERITKMAIAGAAMEGKRAHGKGACQGCGYRDASLHRVIRGSAEELKESKRLKGQGSCLLVERMYSLYAETCGHCDMELRRNLHEMLVKGLIVRRGGASRS